MSAKLLIEPMPRRFQFRPPACIRLHPSVPRVDNARWLPDAVAFARV